jgi:Protein of unknown function (DUF2970)
MSLAARGKEADAANPRIADGSIRDRPADSASPTALSNSPQLLLFRALVSADHEAVKETKERTMNFLKMMRIVLWSFFGVRKSASHQADMAGVKLPMLPVMAVVLAGGFGAVLFSLARLAVSVAH